jgi:hypothetical protein
MKMSSRGEGKISISKVWSDYYMSWYYKIMYIKWNGKDAIAVLNFDSMNYSVFLIKPGIIKTDMSLNCCHDHTLSIDKAEYLCNKSYLHVTDNTKLYPNVLHLSLFDLDCHVADKIQWSEICENMK